MGTTKKIKGTITVEFEMKTDRLSVTEMGAYMKSQLKSALTEEWQVSRCNPVMSSFKFKETK